MREGEPQSMKCMEVELKWVSDSRLEGGTAAIESAAALAGLGGSSQT